MNKIDNILATITILFSLIFIWVITMIILFGQQLLGIFLGAYFFNGGLDDVISEATNLATTTSKVITAFVFAAFTYHTIIKFSLRYIEASALKIVAAVVLFFFLSLNMPAVFLNGMNHKALSWGFYLLSLIILGLHLWSRKDELPLEKVTNFLKEKGLING